MNYLLISSNILYILILFYRKIYNFAFINLNKANFQFIIFLNINCKIIIDELKKMNLNPMSCIPLKLVRNNSVYKIIFLPSIFTYLLYIYTQNLFQQYRIYWEKFIKIREYIQCYNCQAFSNTSSNCFKSPKYIKYREAHPSRTCSKLAHEISKC